MKTKFNGDRTQLTITINAKERRELSEESEIHCDHKMHDWLEPLICNSELDWVDPSQTGDLTSAPMLATRNYDEKTKTETILERWAFMDYQVCSLLERLRDTGQAVLIGGQIWTQSNWATWTQSKTGAPLNRATKSTTGHKLMTTYNLDEAAAEFDRQRAQSDHWPEPTITPQAGAVKPLPTALEDTVDAFLKENSTELFSLAQNRIQKLTADCEALNDEIEHLRAVAQRAQQREVEAVKRCEALEAKLRIIHDLAGLPDGN